MMKKIGIALIGEVYNLPVPERSLPGIFKRDWTLTRDNIKTNLIGSFKKTNKVDVYITSYEETRSDELVNFYSPTKSLWLPGVNSHQRLTYIKSMENLLDQDLDFIITTRFDMSFIDEAVNFNWDYDKMNFACKETHWDQHRYITDAFFGFPKKYLEIFINSIKQSHEDLCMRFPSQIGYWFMHDIYRFTELPEENIHFLIPGNHSTLDVPNLYRIVRA